MPPPLPITEFTDTVINTYGLVVALVRWQMVTFVTSAAETTTVTFPVETVAPTVAVTAKVDVPTTVGVPLRIPVFASVSPVGRVPEPRA